ncbi:hypothetical protein HK105_203035 [Polyrhizophydium stewartii]|uniref:Histone deacetylase domain-containing protein n=1 Tax=Polyrhizophydium stewartii TaxID=2732419 RepID=A0ABR4ND40_9FUNG
MATDQELLAPPEFVRRYRHFPSADKKDTANTDQKPLAWIRGATDLNPRLRRWVLELDEHNSLVAHVPEETNLPADYLSWATICKPLHGLVGRDLVDLIQAHLDAVTRDLSSSTSTVRLPNLKGSPRLLAPRYCGPFTIARVGAKHDNVKIDLLDVPQARAWFHICLIVLYEDPSIHFPSCTTPPPPDINDMGDKRHEMDRPIVAKYNESFNGWKRETEILAMAKDTLVEFCKDDDLQPLPDRPGHAAWIEIGGNPDGVFPDTFAVRLSQIYQDISDGGAGGRPGFFSYDMTAIIAKDTYTAAYEAAQVATTGAEILASEKRRAVFALCRPPGHHSSEDLAGGYCFFNNAGIAAERLIKHHGFGNVVILDIDYHHGNGTQAIFYKRHNPMYASIHGDPDYPYFWGRAEETGEGEGKGANVNVPLPIGTGDDEYLAALDALIANHIVPYGIQALVVSLGVDTFGGDPVGSFNLTSACFERIGERLARIGVPTLFVMEGGYAVSEIGTNVTNVLLAFERAAGSQ